MDVAMPTLDPAMLRSDELLQLNRRNKKDDA